MKSRLAQTLLVASLCAFALAASSENATPRDNPVPANTIDATQNGTQTGTTNSTLPAGATAPAMKYRRFSDADLRAYKDARTACDHMTGAQQTSCRTQFVATWSNVDPKCEKLSGSALDDCLKGADRGAQ